MRKNTQRHLNGFKMETENQWDLPSLFLFFPVYGTVSNITLKRIET